MAFCNVEGLEISSH